MAKWVTASCGIFLFISALYTTISHSGETTRIFRKPVDYPDQALTLVTRIDQKFRSSDRTIPSDILWNEVLRRVNDKDLLFKFSQIDWHDLATVLKDAARFHPELEMNQGVAENLIKIWAMAARCRESCKAYDTKGIIPGLSDRNIDHVIAKIPRSSFDKRRAGEFRFDRYSAKSAFLASIPVSKLDFLYRTAAAHAKADSANGRSDETIGFAVYLENPEADGAFSIDGIQVLLDLFEDIRFPDKEIMILIDRWGTWGFKLARNDFFADLSKVRFSGSIRGVEPGQILFPSEPVMEFWGTPTEIFMLAYIMDNFGIPLLTERTTTLTSGVETMLGNSPTSPKRPVFRLRSLSHSLQIYRFWNPEDGKAYADVTTDASVEMSSGRPLFRELFWEGERVAPKPQSSEIINVAKDRTESMVSDFAVGTLIDCGRAL